MKRLPKWERKHIKDWYLGRKQDQNTMRSTKHELPFIDSMTYEGSFQQRWDLNFLKLLEKDLP